MKKSIGKKIILSYFLILIISFALVGTMFYFITLNYIERSVIKQLIIQGREATALINKSLENRKIFKERSFLGIVRGAFLWRKMQISGQDYAILDPWGKVLFTNVTSLEGKSIDIDNFKRIGRRDYYSRKGDKISVILPLDRGYLMLSGRLTGIKIMTLEILRILLLTFLISGLIVIMIGMFLSRSITAPIKKMAIVASRLKERDFDVAIDINTGDELQELGDTINDLARKLKDYDLAQKRFFQNVSHELKTPLMSIQGYAEGIKDGVFKEDGIEVILNETTRMRKLVNDIIYLSKLETANDFNFAETDINEIIRKSVEKFEGAAKLRNIEIEMKLDGPGQIRGDEEKLLQAVANLLSNAVKYARSKICVLKEVKDSRVIIEVADDGEGIDSEELDRVFERFYKGKDGDTGIGLSIVKTIVEKHGGKVSAYNRKNRGAVFRIEIPQNFHT